MGMSMKKYTILLLTAVILVGAFSQPLFSQDEKRAQTGFKFLSVATDARSAALSGALTAQEGKSTSLFYNPASMARMTNFMHGSLGQVRWIADINYTFGSAAFAPMDGAWGIIGLSLLSVDYGDLQGTILANNEQGYLDTGTFNPNAYAIGLGYAKALTNKFAVGGHIKFVKQDLTGGIIGFNQNEGQISSNFEADVLAFDFGILYKTGYRSLNFGMNIRNFSEEIEYIEESFQLPLLFEMGLSFNLIDLTEVNPHTHSLLFAIDYSHPRDFDEQIDLGLEYLFMNSFALRMGYTTPTDEQGMTLGAGFNPSYGDYSFGIDYAYTPFGIFNEVHRFSFYFSF